MRVLFLIILSLMLNGYSWAYLTAGKIAVTATSSSSGVPSTSQDSDITDTKGSSVSVGVPVAVTGNVNITGNYQVNGTPISATSNWNQSGSTINYTAGNVGIGTNVPGTALDVVGTVRATNFIGMYPSQNVVTGSRTGGVVYRNTTGRTMYVSMAWSSGINVVGNIYSDSSSSPSTVVATSQTGPAGQYATMAFMVLNNNYYEASNNNIQSWVEWY